jgi:thioredoxin-like negative regulator of GroEL
MNVDENMVVPNTFHIQGIPTMILFKAGVPAEVIVGMRPLHELQELLRKHM